MGSRCWLRWAWLVWVVACGGEGSVLAPEVAPATVQSSGGPFSPPPETCAEQGFPDPRPDFTPPTPTGRETYSVAYDAARGVTVLVPGSREPEDHSDTPPTWSSETWEWVGTTWTRRFPTTSPPERDGHALAYDAARGVTVLFGGFGTGACGGAPGSSRCSDTWEWDGTTWTQRTPATSPPARSGHALVYDAARGVTVLFGGSAGWGDEGACGTPGSSRCSDTWEWDGNTWTQRTPITSPPARVYHALAYDAARGVTFLFGGFGTSSGACDTLGSHYCSDIWEWDGTTWTEVTPATSPPARSFHALAYDAARGVTVLFGGSGTENDACGTPGRRTCSDTWEWNGTTWTEVTPATSPPARSDTALAYHAARGVTVLFRPSCWRCPDTWEWDGLDWKEASLSGPPPEDPLLSGPAAWDCATTTETLSWTGSPGALYDVHVNGRKVAEGLSEPSLSTAGIVFEPGDNTWQVRAYNCAGDEAWSEEGALEVSASAVTPVAPSITDPPNGSVQYCDPTITWTYPGSTDGIVFEVRKQDGTVLATDLTGPSWTPTGDERLESGQLAYRVVARACDGSAEAPSGARGMTINNTPPTPLLDSPGVSEFTTPTPTFSWSTTTTPAEDVRYTVRVNGEPVAAGLDETSWTLPASSALPDGPHTWQVEAEGCLGATSTSGAPRAFQVDGTPPEPFTPTSPADGAWTNADEITLTWPEPSDGEGSGVVSYVVEFSTDTYGPVVDPFYDLSLLPTWRYPNGVYPWFVTAVDAVGNERASEVFSLGIDRIPPAPAPGVSEVISVSGTPELTWTASEDALSGVGAYEIWISGALAGTVDGDTLSWNVEQALEEGRHDWVVRAVDRAGNVRESDTGQILIDQTPPVFVGLEGVDPSGGDGWVSSNIPTFRFTGFDLREWVGVNPSADPGISYFEVFIDGEPNGFNPVPGDAYCADGRARWWSPEPEASDDTDEGEETGIDTGYQAREVRLRHVCSDSFDFLMDGAYTWHVVAYDHAGLSTASEEGTFVVETQPPDPFNHLSPGNGEVVGALAPLLCWEETVDLGSGVAAYDVVMSRSGEADVVWEVIPGEDDQLCSRVPVALANGAWTWQVTARDAAGNTTSANFGAPWSMTVDADVTPPQTSITDPEIDNELTGCEDRVIAGTARDPGPSPTVPPGSGVVEVEVQLGATHADGWTSASLGGTPSDLVRPWTWELQGATTGSVTLYARARDAEGNVQPEPTERVLDVDCTGPEAFALLSPQTDAFAGGCPSFSWENTTDSPAGLAGFTLVIENAEGVVRAIDAGLETSWTLSGAECLEDGGYTWHVVAADVLANTTRSTNVRNLRVDQTPPVGFPLLSRGPVNAEGWGCNAGPDGRGVIDVSWSATQDDGPGGGVGMASQPYQMRLNGSSFGTRTSELAGQFGGLHDGSYTWTVRAFDALNNFRDATPNDLDTFRIDCTPPTRPVLQTPADRSWTTERRPELAWSPSTDGGSGVSRVAVVINGEVAAAELPAGATSYTLTEVDSLAEGEHQWSVRVFDRVGNVSESQPFELFTDYSPPEPFSVTLPVEGDVVVTSTPTLHWERATDLGVGVAGYEVFVNEAFLVAQTPDGSGCSAAGTGERCVEVAEPLPDGQHCFFVTAEDGLGWTRESRNTSCFIVDTLPPEDFSLLEPEPGAESFTARPEFCWESTTDAGTGVVRYEVWLSGNQVATIPSPEEPVPASLCWQPDNPLDNGPYEWFVRAVDGASGVTQTSTRMVVIDRDITEPDVQIVSPAGGELFGAGGVPISGTATDGPRGTGVVRVEVFDETASGQGVDADWDPVTKTWSMVWPAEVSGDLTLCARGWDAEGNANPSSGGTFPRPCVSVRIDVSPPSAFSVLSPAGNGWVAARPTFVWEESSPGPSGMDRYEVQISGLERILVESGTTYALPADRALTEGSYSWTASAYDRLGNTRQASNTETFRVDATPPGAAAPASPEDGAWVNSLRPEVCWSEAEDAPGGSGVGGYVVRWNGMAQEHGEDTTCASPPQDLTEGTHTWDVAAVDRVGNEGPVSGERTLRIDVTPPPAPTPTAPDDGAVVLDQPTLSWLAVTDLPAGQASGVCGYEVLVDGAVERVSGEQLSLQWPSVLPDGPVSWQVRAVDCAGNVGSSSPSRTVTVDSTAPSEVVVLAPQTDAWLTDGAVTVSWEPSEDPIAGVCGYRVAIAGDEETVGAETTSLAWPVTLGSGTYEVRVVAEDCAGNLSVPTEVPFGVDLDDPTPASGLSPDGGACVVQAPTLSFTACTDATSGVAYQRILLNDSEIAELDGAAESYALSSSLSDGDYRWMVVCEDLAGRTSESAEATFTLDAAQPTLTVDGVEEDGFNFTLSGTVVSGSTCGAAWVEVSVDGSTTWQTAAMGSGTEWTFEWPAVEGESTFDVRVVVDGVAAVVSEGWTVRAEDCWLPGACDELLRDCSEPVASGTSCEDGDPCTEDTTCDGAGVCGDGVDVCPDTGDTGVDDTGSTEDTGDDSGPGEPGEPGEPGDPGEGGDPSGPGSGGEDGEGESEAEGCGGGCAVTSASPGMAWGLLWMLGAVAVRRRRAEAVVHREKSGL